MRSLYEKLEQPIVALKIDEWYVSAEKRRDNIVVFQEGWHNIVFEYSGESVESTLGELMKFYYEWSKEFHWVCTFDDNFQKKFKDMEVNKEINMSDANFLNSSLSK
jgi:hypothetical protein